MKLLNRETQVTHFLSQNLPLLSNYQILFFSSLFFITFVRLETSVDTIFILKSPGALASVMLPFLILLSTVKENRENTT